MVHHILVRALGLSAVVMMLGGSPALAQGNQGGNQGNQGNATRAPEFDVSAVGAAAAILAAGGIVLARRRRR